MSRMSDLYLALPPPRNTPLINIISNMPSRAGLISGASECEQKFIILRDYINNYYCMSKKSFPILNSEYAIHID